MWTESTPTIASVHQSGQVQLCLNQILNIQIYIMASMHEPIYNLTTLGQYCAEDVNECLMQPNACHNGGTCFNTIGGHTCVCVNGWTGDDCSENIDDCAIAVCFNGATCHDRVASFFCECPFGKTGKWVYQMASVALLVLAAKWLLNR